MAKAKSVAEFVDDILRDTPVVELRDELVEELERRDRTDDDLLLKDFSSGMFPIIGTRGIRISVGTYSDEYDRLVTPSELVQHHATWNEKNVPLQTQVKAVKELKILLGKIESLLQNIDGIQGRDEGAAA